MKALLRRLRRLRGLRLGQWIAGFFLAFAILTPALDLYSANHSPHKPQWYGMRDQLEARIRETPGRHVVLVAYTRDHYVHEELVYNSADIDSQEVVWARSMGPAKDQRVLDYYPDRYVWYLLRSNVRGTVRLLRPPL